MSRVPAAARKISIKGATTTLSGIIIIIIIIERLREQCLNFYLFREFKLVT